MCDALVWSYGAIKSIDWLEIIKTLAAVGTAIIAFLALRNWQRQDKAKREAEFLDTVIEAAHAYIAQMSQPIALLEVAKMGMEGHVPTWEEGDEADKALRGAIAYIERRGESEAKHLLDVLGVIRPSVTKLRSLIVKGQVFKFDGYAECQSAIDKLIWLFSRIEAFAVIIGSPHWNWDNPEVLARLKEQVAIDPQELHKIAHESDVAVIVFARGAYKRIYK